MALFINHLIRENVTLRGGHQAGLLAKYTHFLSIAGKGWELWLSITPFFVHVKGAETMVTYTILQLEAPRVIHPPFQILPDKQSMTNVSIFASAPNICASTVMLHSHGEWKHWMLPVSKFSISPVTGQVPTAMIELTMQFGCISSSIGSFSVTSEAGPFDSEILGPGNHCVGHIRGLRSIKEIDEDEK